MVELGIYHHYKGYKYKVIANGLLEATQQHIDPAVYLFTYLAISTGARLVNICNLKVQDIDFKHKVISIYDYKNKSYYKAFLRSDEEFIQVLKNQLQLILLAQIHN